ncbi:hypothetical protein J6Y73_01015 [bacterium]|nr:hypothetical protein [bacterium]
MARTRSLNFIAFVLNVLTIVLVAMSVVSFFISGGTGNMEVYGVTCFRYFTIDSNILVALVSIPIMIFEIINVIYDKNKIPRIFIILKFIGTVAVMVTLLTVLLFLWNFYPFLLLFSGVSFYLHLICPLFALISFLIETQEEIKPKEFLFGGLSVLIYGIVYLTMVKFRGEWPDFYGFDTNGLEFVSLIVMIILTLALSFGLAKLHKLFKYKIVKY